MADTIQNVSLPITIEILCLSFRTADQAEAMMDPLQRSQTDLSTYLDRLSGTATQADPRGDLSVSGLDKLHKSHESLKSYVRYHL